MDEEVRRLERLALSGDAVAIARFERARKLSGIDIWRDKLDPTRTARERREEAERKRSAEAIEFCRRAVNGGVTANLYRGGQGRECWCAVFMSLRRLEGLHEFTPKETDWSTRWGTLDAEFRGRAYQ